MKENKGNVWFSDIWFIVLFNYSDYSAIYLKVISTRNFTEKNVHLPISRHCSFNFKTIVNHHIYIISNTKPYSIQGQPFYKGNCAFRANPFRDHLAKTCLRYNPKWIDKNKSILCILKKINKSFKERNIYLLKIFWFLLNKIIKAKIFVKRKKTVKRPGNWKIYIKCKYFKTRIFCGFINH